MDEKKAYQWDYAGALAPNKYNAPHQQTFSVGIFQWIPTKDGKRLKRGKVVKRFSGRCDEPNKVYEAARAFIAQQAVIEEGGREGKDGA